MTCTTNQTPTCSTTTHEASTRCSLEDHLILIESELNCVRKYTDSQTKYLHLERAKHELQRALLEVWHSFHVSGKPY
jgi:hypothetical protein